MVGGETVKILIHACPQRMWYVEEFLAPGLEAQGAENVEIWNDTEGKGNLISCMESFAARQGYGGTWHIQDDILPCRDFVQRCREYESDGVVYGFCCEQFQDDPQRSGRVKVEDCWHSFQCVRIPDEYARDCAEWFAHRGWARSTLPELSILRGKREGDDTFFREYLQLEHRNEHVTNAKPNLVEHVDWIVGGSVLHQWRGYLARASWWDDEELILDLKEAVKGKVQYVV